MHDLLSELYIALLRATGTSVEETSERTQAQALFVISGLFGLVAGCLTTDLASTVWFGVAGTCGFLFLVVTYCVKE